jgi:hypothetical protein
MLKIFIKGGEYLENDTGLIKQAKDQTLSLEHSLVSLQKWESKWEVPFLLNNPKDPRSEKTTEMLVDYIRCMTITQNVDPNIYYFITETQFKEIQEYIAKPMTATTFNDKQRPSREIATAEVIYSSMFMFNIPFECRKWHLNSLLTLIHVCSIKNQGDKQMSSAEYAKYRHSINSARQAARK